MKRGAGNIGNNNAAKLDEPIRILHYIGSLDFGGSQTMIMNIYRNIDRDKIQFDFVIDRKNEKQFVKEIESLGGKVYVFEEYFRGYNYLNFVKQWKQFFKEHPEYKIIHCHVRSVASIVLRIAKKNGLKTICHSHSTSNGKGFKGIAKKVLQSRIKKNCDYYFACSEESAKWLYGDKIAGADNCMIIKNTVDASKYVFDGKVRGRVRKSLGIDNKIVLGQVGRIEAVKNYEFSLKLLEKLLENDGRYFLLVVGSGSLKSDFLEKAEELGIVDNIMILENRSDVDNLMQAMDIFIMPSLWEGLPMALVEAQAASLPCVISNAIKDGVIDDRLVRRADIGNNDEWREIVMGLSGGMGIRKNNSGLIVRSGFDVKDNAKNLSEFYINLVKKNSKKIYFCLGSMEHGGAERVVANLCNYFVKENNVKIIVTKRWRPEYDLDNNIGHYVLDNGGSAGFLRRTVCRVKKLRYILKRESPDIVIAFLPEPSFRLMLAKIFLPVKTVISVRNDPNREYDNVIKRILVKLLYSKADGFVFQTTDAQKWFSGKIQSKSVVIPNPVDEAFLRKPYSGEREKRIVTVGRLVEQKNQKLLIDAFSEFYKKHEDYRLEIYGDGPLKTKLQSYINKLGLTDVAKLLGEVPEVGDRIYKAGVFVLTSDYEGMPNALMEAMALGVPCISTDCPVGGPRYLIKNNLNGILVKVKDVREVVGALNKIVNDEKFSKMIALNANHDMTRFDIKIINNEWSRCIERALGGVD